MKVGFAITYCCEQLQLSMINREWWFEIDTQNDKVKLVPSENEELWRETCPFCSRNMIDVIDLDIKE